MAKIYITKYSILGLAAAGLLSACGGSDSNKKNSDSGVDTFAENVSFTALEATKGAIGKEDAPSLIGGLNLPQKSELPVTGTVEESVSLPGSCGGSVNVDTVVSTNDMGAEAASYSVEANFVFNDFCVSLDGDSDAIYEGTAFYGYWETDTESTYEYSFDLDYTVSGTVDYAGVINSGEHCSRALSGPMECQLSSPTYEFEDSPNYALLGVEVSLDENSSYMINADIVNVDNVFHSYSFSATGVATCENGNLGSGLFIIEVEDDQTVEVEFISCDEYVVSYQGVSEVFSQ